MMEGPVASLLARRAIGTGEEENLTRELPREWILWPGDMDWDTVGLTCRLELCWPCRPRVSSVIEDGSPVSIKGFSMSNTFRLSFDNADDGWLSSQFCTLLEPLDFLELVTLLFFEESLDEVIFLLALLEGRVLPSLMVLRSSASSSALALTTVLPSSSEPSSALALLRLSVSEESDVSLALA